jgi:hypothetical protein
MWLLNRIRNSTSVPGFLVNSMPKAGTHLLMKAMGMFPGIRRIRGQVTNRLAERYPTPTEGQPTAMIGVDWPKPVALPALRHALYRVRRGRFVQAHTRFSPELVDLLLELDMKTLLILRDPRDVVLSHANYVARKPRHFLYPVYQPLSESERILTSITGIASSAAEAPTLLDIGERYRSLLPWLTHPVNYTTYFEKLVGPQGGGSREEQIQEIESCARHLGIKYTPNRITYIADRLFGGTNTFRKGVIGNWRDRLSEEQKDAFKKVAGQVLIDLGYEQDTDW